MVDGSCPDTGTGGTGTSSGAGGSSGGGGVYGGYPTLIPDGPGCYDSTCGGCADDPSCQDNLNDYGDCGCLPPAPGQAQ
jgi:hypothetical protein